MPVVEIKGDNKVRPHVVGGRAVELWKVLQPRSYEAFDNSMSRVMKDETQVQEAQGSTIAKSLGPLCDLQTRID